MKNIFIKLFIITTIITFSTNINVMAEEYSSLEDKFAYVFGRDIAKRIIDDAERNNLKKDILLKGLNDYIKDRKSPYDEETSRKITQEFSQKMREKFESEQKKLTEEANILGKNFMDKNKNKEGVMVTKSGIQYKVLKAGDGPKPKATDIVKVHYRGTLADGKEFDSSYTRGTPAEFPLNQVIPGWTEGVQLMNVGSKYELVIPSELGYGLKGAGNAIPPNSVLIFEVELLEIVKK